MEHVVLDEAREQRFELRRGIGHRPRCPAIFSVRAVIARASSIRQASSDLPSRCRDLGERQLLELSQQDDLAVGVAERSSAASRALGLLVRLLVEDHLRERRSHARRQSGWSSSGDSRRRVTPLAVVIVGAIDGSRVRRSAPATPSTTGRHRHRNSSRCWSDLRSVAWRMSRDSSRSRNERPSFSRM